MNYIPKNIISMFIGLLIVGVFNILPDIAFAEENIPIPSEGISAVGPASTVFKTPFFEGLGIVVYKVIVTGGQGLEVEASDCCVPGDLYKIIMKQKMPFETRLKGKEDRVGGYTCNPDETTTYPVGTLESWQEGRVKIKRLYGTGGSLASAYMRFKSDGTVSVKEVKGFGDACGF